MSGKKHRSHISSKAAKARGWKGKDFGNSIGPFRLRPKPNSAQGRSVSKNKEGDGAPEV